MSIDIRPLDEKEIERLAALHVASIKDAYEDFVDPEYLASLNVEDRTAKWQEWFTPDERPLYMAWDGDAPAGFVNFGKIRTAPPGGSPVRPLYTSEIFAIYTAKDYWGKGIGSALFKTAAQKLSEMKHHSLCLWVLDKNTRAVDFYKHKGGQRCGKMQIEMGRSKLKEVCYGWRDTSGLT